MSSLSQPIVIFDSGVGGLSIYQRVKATLNCPVVYCSDSAGFPYGPRPSGEVIKRTYACLMELKQSFNPSLAVIACNTASTVSLPTVRKALDIPVVGVVPAIKTASQQSIKRCIGLLATPGTISREYTDQLIDDFASDCRVIRVGSSRLVELAEDYLRGKPVDRVCLKKIIAPFFQEQPWPDTIVLGCTHFPLIEHLLQSVVPVAINWVDSGDAIANRVRHLLTGSKVTLQISESDRFLYTGNSMEIEGLIPVLQKMGFASAEMMRPSEIFTGR
ncbi:Glutamate racemase [invertebrate metagenome]|uniref:glutamate racemase n=1 Tax=invertebrate metagenome TaxID=1711999 RepID=A0A2H9T4C9_9ZZZZ